jgi:UDP-N-acetylglucosamine--N-acetylmuramyl-(pentapeptide) pyrophosphoryl-undecaprenol N-acetylglucosamine transferase
MNSEAGQGGTVVFAGGGTGGHLFPSLAIAERLAEQAGAPVVHYICSAKPLDAEILRKAKVTFTPVPVRGFSSNPLRWPGFAYRLIRSVQISRLTLAVREAGVVVAMGGYVSAPVVAAARRLHIPVMLVNLDAVAGRANRRVARRADEIFSVYESPGLGRPSRSVAFPIRRAAIGSLEPAEARAKLGLTPDKVTLLVTGASQGAKSINEAMIELAARDALGDWQVLHLAGPGNAEAVEAMYSRQAVDAKVLPFLDEMGLAWSAADVAVSRCGAGSAAEALANAVPTVFMPYPYHADEHQRHNVQALADDGAAVIVKDTKLAKPNADALEPVLNDLMSDGSRRQTMRQILIDRRPADGAAALAEAVMGMLS